ncbi:DNA polymerase III subunit delta [Candidatus Peregrinibacteria bacterium]|jgi:DNA polymerase III subunit delta|nr:DNA polymerase III subunit delta [Candidatus Peregrinibacteria bacterium]MBT4056103.1 DNA polymerase III subunit delta [Candidatus Peregrinibacteria bacterium]
MTKEQLNIHFFYGEDSYSISKKVSFWIDQFKKKHEGDTNIDIIEGKELITKDFGTNLQALPFLAEKRLVIIKDFLDKGSSDDQKIVAEIIKKTPEFCVLVFTEIKTPDKRLTLFKTLTKLSKTEEFKALSPGQLAQWIIKETQDRTSTNTTSTSPSTTPATIDMPTANHLAQHVGPNLWQLSNEIDKLISSAQTQPDNKITKEMIEDLVTPSITSSIFKLTDAIAARDRRRSINLFKTLIDSGEETTMVFYMIVRHFRILIQSHYLTEQGESPNNIAKKLKQHPFVAMTTSKQSKNFTAEKLQTIYKNLLEIDHKFKTGGIKISSDNQMELLLAIEKFIIETCAT